jgi:hypothetical protein
MESLKKIISNIDSLWNDINKEIIIKNILSDINNNRIDIETKIDSIPNKFGIYIFFIKPKASYSNIDSLTNDWLVKDFSNYPKIIKSRFESNTKQDDWYTFYIGKSEKIGKRIYEHLTHHKSHVTYGLKLSERNNFKSKNEIQVGYWLFPDEKISNEVKQFFITNFEKLLREKLNPWIGRQ